MKEPMKSKMLTLDEMVKLANKIAIRDWNDDFFTGTPIVHLDQARSSHFMRIEIGRKGAREDPGKQTYSLRMSSNTNRAQSTNDYSIRIPYDVDLGSYSGADKRVARLYCAASSSCAKRQKNGQTRTFVLSKECPNRTTPTRHSLSKRCSRWQSLEAGTNQTVMRDIIFSDLLSRVMNSKNIV